MKTDLNFILKKVIQDEKINMRVIEISDSEIWVENSDEFLTIKFVLDEIAHKIGYDIFLPKQHIHLKEKTIYDIKKIESNLEKKGLWNLEKYIEDSWLIIDFIRIWAKNNGFQLIETLLI